MRADCHIHIDRIGGPHKTPPPSIDLFIEYARRENISLFFAIYELDETLNRFRSTGFDLVPIYWERNPLNPSVPASARGIKLHPYIEEYPLMIQNVKPTLDLALARNLFVFIHTEDRRPELSRGRLVAELANEYQDLTLIMAHSGSYAPPKMDQPGESWVEPSLVEELVSEAVEVACAHKNVYLETSILASDVKAKILAKAPVSKLLMGCDFPILEGTQWSSLRFQEEQLIRHGLTATDIEQIHRNAMSFFQRASKTITQPL
jgi:predicted TIM-barrel fold metal-dependent hydrolase